MDVERSRRLEEIVLLSQTMLLSADDHQWEAVAECEFRRRELLTRFFEQPTEEQDAAQVAAAIKDILRLNQRIGELGRQCQDQLGNEIQANKAGRTASAAYHGCGR